MNAVIKNTGTDDVTQEKLKQTKKNKKTKQTKKKLAMTPTLWVAKEVDVKKGKRGGEKKSHGGKKELKVILST